MIYRRVIFRGQIVFAIEKKKGFLTLISAAPWLDSRVCSSESGADLYGVAAVVRQAPR